MIVIGRIAAGLGMLVLGRRLFWFFVGSIGFLLGISLAERLLGDQPETTLLVFALVIGLTGALAAYVVQRLAVGATGFIGGGIITVNLLDSLAVEVGSYLLPFLVGGIVGLVLVTVLFDWALIVISSFAGASVIMQLFDMERPLNLIVMAFLSVVGIVAQFSQMRRAEESG